jgi:uncharacterized protein
MTNPGACDIAVVGSGLAGLTAAWLLAHGHRVTLFERAPRVGFTAHGLAVDGARVDVPLRVFAPGYYPTLMRLYAALGVAHEAVSYATSFSDADPTAGGRPYFRWHNLRLGGASWPYVGPSALLDRRARRIALGALHLQRRLRAAAHRLDGVSIGEFAEAERVAPECLDGLLWPTLATIGTCTLADARAVPAALVAGYWRGLAGRSVRRVTLGADAVAARLQQGLVKVVCEAGVEAVTEDAPGSDGQRARHGDAPGPLHDGPPGVWLHRRGLPPERFDHVVLATGAPQALALWRSAPADEAALLARFRTRPLTVLMHRDASFMPALRRDWSAVHAVVDPAAERPESTIWINAVQPALRQAAPLFQTVMPLRPPRDDLMLAEARLERALVDAESHAALVALRERWHATAATRRVWLAGSYAETGVPLLESAVRSAVAVAAALPGSRSPLIST